MYHTLPFSQTKVLSTLLLCTLGHPKTGLAGSGQAGQGILRQSSCLGPGWFRSEAVVTHFEAALAADTRGWPGSLLWSTNYHVRQEKEWLEKGSLCRALTLAPQVIRAFPGTSTVPLNSGLLEDKGQWCGQELLTTSYKSSVSSGEEQQPVPQLPSQPVETKKVFKAEVGLLHATNALSSQTKGASISTARSRPCLPVAEQDSRNCILPGLTVLQPEAREWKPTTT